MIDVAFSYTKLRPSRVLDVAMSIRVAVSSINENGFTVKDSEYFFNMAPSEMENHADKDVSGRNFIVYFVMSKR